MSTARRFISKGVILELTAATSEVGTVNRGMEFAAADDQCKRSGANDDLFIGIALNTAAAGKRCQVQISGIAAVLVGTGGATRGKKAVEVATGMTDAATHDSSGGTDQAICGVFMQSGVADDIIGMLILPNSRGSA